MYYKSYSVDKNMVRTCLDISFETLAQFFGLQKASDLIKYHRNFDHEKNKGDI